MEGVHFKERPLKCLLQGVLLQSSFAVHLAKDDVKPGGQVPRGVEGEDPQVQCAEGGRYRAGGGGKLEKGGADTARAADYVNPGGQVPRGVRILGSKVQKGGRSSVCVGGVESWKTKVRGRHSKAN